MGSQAHFFAKHTKNTTTEGLTSSPPNNAMRKDKREPTLAAPGHRTNGSPDMPARHALTCRSWPPRSLRTRSVPTAAAGIVTPELLEDRMDRRASDPSYHTAYHVPLRGFRYRLSTPPAPRARSGVKTCLRAGSRRHGGPGRTRRHRSCTLRRRLHGAISKLLLEPQGVLEPKEALQPPPSMYSRGIHVRCGIALCTRRRGWAH